MNVESGMDEAGVFWGLILQLVWNSFLSSAGNGRAWHFVWCSYVQISDPVVYPCLLLQYSMSGQSYNLSSPYHARGIACSMVFSGHISVAAPCMWSSYLRFWFSYGAFSAGRISFEIHRGSVVPTFAYLSFRRLKTKNKDYKVTNNLYAHLGNTKLNVIGCLFFDFYVPIKAIENHSIWLSLIFWFSIAIPQVWFGYARLQGVIALLSLDNDISEVHLHGDGNRVHLS